jgi:flagellar hook assembly protein FlgD
MNKPNSFGKNLGLALGLVMGLAGARSLSAASTILSLSYAASNPTIHIGTNITINMVVLNATAAMNTVTTSNPLVSSLTINSPDLTGLSFGTQIFITDGTRTWTLTTGLPGPSVVINDSVLLGGGAVPSWAVPNYVALQNQSFRIYTGNLAVNGGPYVNSADLGAFGSVVLHDDGTLGDTGLSDGIWSGVYSVPDLGMVVSGSRLYGHAYNSSIVAVNDAFQSPQTLSVDALRPALNSVNFTVPSKPNYNNVLYLSALSQGTTSAQQTNTLGRFDVVVNKVDTVVDVTIYNGAGVAVKNLPSMIVPPGSATLNAWGTWKGDDNSGLYVADGVYPTSIYIHDSAGISGVTHTTEVRVTSMRFEIADIRMLPSGRTTQPSFTKGLITTIKSHIVAFRDNYASYAGVGTGLAQSLKALNWPSGSYFCDTFTGTTQAVDYAGASNAGAVWTLQESSFLDQSGATVFGIDPVANHDSISGYDSDQDYIARFGGDCAIAGATPDGDKGNDWDSSVIAEMLQDTNIVPSQTSADPAFLTANYGVDVIGASPPQGNYRLRLRAKLTGLTAGFKDGKTHFYPDSNPEGGTINRGLGIYTEDSSLIFQVSDVITPSSDTTAPVFLVSAPVSGSTVDPSTYGPSNVLSAQFQDQESAMNSSGSVSYITVTDPQGGVVPGQSTTNGGGSNNTLTIYFKPYAVLNKGGNYKMTVNTCNNAGLCVSKDIPFTVLDQTAPSVSAVELAHLSGGANEQLSINQSAAEGPFQDISEVWVTLSVPATSTNVIAWDLSSVTLYQVVGGNRVPVPMTRLTTGTPSDGRLRYKINSSINYAGLFEVDTLTASRDSSGTTFSGPPAGTIKPQFTTEVCVACVNILYPPPGTDPTRPAITAFNSVTLTSGATSLVPGNVGVDAPAASAMPADTGWVQLNSTLAATSMRFFYLGVQQVSPLTWTYLNTAPVTFAMYYNDADLPAGIAETDLVVRAYSGGTWNTLGTVVHDSLPTTANAFRFSPVSSQPAALYYAIKYASVSGSSSGVPTPTPFANTRSFNPVSSDPIHKRARFYYGTQAPTKAEVRIYDSGGRLVRQMALGQGVNASSYVLDANNNAVFYFDWDGQNDSGTVVRNGVYLVLWNVTFTDGTSQSMTKPVALIK